MKNRVYIHDIPGRLRVRTEAIKNNERSAAEARRVAELMPGVSSVKANTTTGSITVAYDYGCLNSEMIFTALRKGGWLDQPVSRAQPAASVTGSTIIRTVLPKIGEMLLGWTIEQALTAAVIALL